MWIVSVHGVTDGGIKFSDYGDFQEGEVPVCLSLNGELNAGLYVINEVKILNCLGLRPSSPKHCLKRLCITGDSANPWRIRSQVELAFETSMKYGCGFSLALLG
jgi:hypothetical protein